MRTPIRIACVICPTRLKPTQTKYCSLACRYKGLAADCHTAETYAAVSKALKSAWGEKRDEIIASQRAGHATELGKKNSGDAMRKRWAKGPVISREQQSAGSREYLNRPEVKARSRERMRRRHVETNLNEHIRAAVKRTWEERGPELRVMAAERLKKQGRPRYEYLDRKGRLWRFRSGEKWELGAAKWFDSRELNWRYEPDVLLLSDGRAYLPDFWVDEWNCYVEIKGFARRIDKVDLANTDGHVVLLITALTQLEEVVL